MKKSLFIIIVFCFYSNSFFAQENELNTIISDFQVNTETKGPHQALKFAAEIAHDSTGRFVISWIDMRNGRKDVFAKLYDKNGLPIDKDFKVNIETDCEYQSVVMFDDGNFLIIWVHGNNILGQNFDKAGNKIGDNFPIKTDINISNNLYFSDQTRILSKIISDKDIIISWQVDNLIYAQKFKNDGTPIDSSFIVNTNNKYAVGQFDIDVNLNGDFIFVWAQTIPNVYNIYARRYFDNGSEMDSIVKVTDKDLGNDTPIVKIINTDNDNYIIYWINTILYAIAPNTPDPRSTVYFQMVTSELDRIGNNVKVNQDSICYIPNSLLIEQNNGNILAFWYRTNSLYFPDSSLKDGSILGQIISPIAEKIDDNFVVFDNANKNVLQPSNLSMINDQTVIAINKGYFAQKLNFENEHEVFPKFKVNNDTSFADHNNPILTVDDVGNFNICWTDDRNNSEPIEAKEIFVQQFNNNGSFKNSNFSIKSTTDTLSYVYYYPSLAALENGDFILTFTKDKNIYAQLYKMTGEKIGLNMKINKDSSDQYKSFSNVFPNKNNFLITWTNGKIIWGKVIDINGNIIKDVFIIYEDIKNDYLDYPKSFISSEGYFVVSWLGIYNKEILAQIFSPEMKPINASFLVNTDNNDKFTFSYDIDGDDKGNFIITWTNDYWGEIYFNKYNYEGTQIGLATKVNSNYVGQSVQIGVERNGNFIIEWLYQTNQPLQNYNLYAQRFDSTGNQIGNNFKVASSSGSYNLKLKNENIYNTWTAVNPFLENCNIIMANEIDWHNPILGLNIDEEIPLEYSLSQNYPNPFNPTTTINYSIPSYSVILSEVKNLKDFSAQDPRNDNVTLKVYDVLGREVATLVNKVQQPGNYEVTFNAASVSRRIASGIYYYSLKAGNYVQTKKMVLLK
ncbi:MAG: hypothetical protein WAR79_06700 [Melioribacteraceae bacterium]